MLPCCIHLMCIHICQLLPVLCLLSYIGKCASQGNHLTQSYYLQPAHTLDAVRLKLHACIKFKDVCNGRMYDPQAGGKQGLCHQYSPKAGAVSPIQPQSRGCVTNTAPKQGLCHQYSPQSRGCVTNAAPKQGLYHQYSPKACFIYCNL